MVTSTQISLASSKNIQNANCEYSYRGILIAFTIIFIWVVSLIFLISPNLYVQTRWVPLAVLWQTFLYTGLFITAHDAMHGVVFRQNIKINNWFGRVAVCLYALFSYDKLLKKHWLHHHNPASNIDPDFHDGKHKNLFAWYFHFMKGYWDWRQIIGLIVIFHIIRYTLHIPDIKLSLFWIIPSILSSFQLFFFGTFLPHREPEAGYTNIHRTQSTSLPIFWSFISCYHFGYHEEHHEYPRVPWWNLPTIYRMKQNISNE